MVANGKVMHASTIHFTLISNEAAFVGTDGLLVGTKVWSAINFNPRLPPPNFLNTSPGNIIGIFAS